MRKFNFVVIDDKQKNDEGWYRIFERVLISKDYLVPGRVKEDLFGVSQSLLQKTTSSKTWAMNYTILSSENGFDFNKAKDCLIASEKDFDFFFIDIDLRFGGFLNEARVDNPSLQKNLLQSPELAGFQFIRFLPAGKRPIFFFSGAKITTINKALSTLSTWGDRLSDVCFGKMEMASMPEEDEEFTFDEPYNFIDLIDERLEQYMTMVQLDVCSRLDVSMVNQLRLMVEKNDVDAFDEAIIPCYKRPGEYWSLRSLFPKHTNKIELNRSTAEKYRQDIIATLQTDWRTLMCHFAEPGQKAYHGLLRHPENIIHIDKLLEAVEQLELEETKQIPGWVYIQVTKLPDYEEFKKGITGLDNYKKTNSRIADSLHTIIQEQKRTDPTWKDIHVLDTKHIWAEHYGILPTDILHIHKIALNNGETHRSKLVSFGFEPTPNNKSITFEWKFLVGFSLSMQAERRMLKKMNEKPLTLTAGLVDISILACIRYKGQFEVFEPSTQKAITITYKHGEFQLYGHEELEEARGYRITIQAPNYVQTQNTNYRQT